MSETTLRLGGLLAGMPLGFASPVHAQIQPSGYMCSAEYVRTHNKSTGITMRTLACGAGHQSAYAHWYDLAVDVDLARQYVTLRCVDFSLWSSSLVGAQVIFVRVDQDLTIGRQGACTDQGYGDPADPGPDAAGRLLLWEGWTAFPPSNEGVDSETSPRPDGDRSVRVGPDINFDGLPDGIVLPPDAQFFVEVGDLGEAVARFGANGAGETGDDEGPASANVTWVRHPDCSGGGCVTVGGIDGGDYARHGEWAPTFEDRDFVMRVHLDRGQHVCPPVFCGNCLSDSTGGRDGGPDHEVDVSDLLAVLAAWGPQPMDSVIDFAPTCGCDPLYAGDGAVDTTDLLTLLAEWGPCCVPNSLCADAFESSMTDGPIVEGEIPYRTNAQRLDGPVRPATNDVGDILSGPTDCGWHDYGAGAIDGEYRYGDAFGIDAATGGSGGDVWFRYYAGCDGAVTFTTQTDCLPEDIVDTIMEIYPGDACPIDWTQVIACDDSSALGCGDHASITLEVVEGEALLVRIAGKFGAVGEGLLTVTHEAVANFDCNGNGLNDTCDINRGRSADVHGNGVPDECDARGDFNGDGTVNVNDLLAMLVAWGPCASECPPDTNSDGAVNVVDLLTQLANWG